MPFDGGPGPHHWKGRQMSRSQGWLRQFKFALLGAVSASCLAAAAAAAEERDPLQSVPGTCNAVAVVQMKKLINSPVGKKKKWWDQARRAYAEGLLSGPPWVNEIVQATTIGSAPGGGRPLTYSIYLMDQPSVMYDIAKHELSPLEKIAGHGATLSSRHVYFVQLAPGMVGALEPADRHAVSHWVRAIDDKQLVPLKPELVDAVKTDDDVLVSLAADLRDVLNPHHIRNWIKGTPRLRSAPDVDGLVEVLTSLRLARLQLRVTDSIVARLELDFDSPLGNHVAAAQTAVGQWLDDAGARPQILREAKATVGEKSLSFEAPLDEIGLRRILSLVQSPHLPVKEADASEGHQPNAVASAAYYDKVCDLLNSLLYKNRNASSYNKTALWHEQFARRITNLSTLAVDPALVRWASDVSKELLALASSLRGEHVRLDDLERSIRFNETTHWQWYADTVDGPLYFPAWVSTDNNLELVRAQQDSDVEKGADQRDAIWNMLRQETADVAHHIESIYHIKLKLPQ
jgi:hypothetical protein